MNQNLSISLGGHVKAWTIDQYGNRVLVIDQKNATQPNANIIISSLLAGQVGYDLGFVKAFKTGVLLADTAYGIVTKPSATQVEVTCIFNEIDFNDTLDEVRLHTKFGGVLTLLTGLSIAKDDTLKLQIVWRLTINAT